MQLLDREDSNQEGAAAHKMSNRFVMELVDGKQYHPCRVIMNKLDVTAWWEACWAVKKWDWNPDRSSLLFFYTQDLSNAAAPTKTAAGDPRGDTPCQTDKKQLNKTWLLPLMTLFLYSNSNYGKHFFTLSWRWWRSVHPVIKKVRLLIPVMNTMVDDRGTCQTLGWNHCCSWLAALHCKLSSICQLCLPLHIPSRLF